MTVQPPAPNEIRELRRSLSDWLVATPVVRLSALEADIGGDTRVLGKLEFLQRTGTFKARGALSVLLGLDAPQRAAGVTAVSAGNHAIAVAFAARAAGTSAKVVMLRQSNPERMERCRAYGAEVVLADDVHAAFDAAERIRSEEGRFFVHPFEGPDIVRGTASVGLEICEQVTDVDAVLVPVGGGGLCAGIASAVKQLRPSCRVFGVEPEGADSMHRSIVAGEPVAIERVTTIADSLGAPHAMPYSFSLCRRFVDEWALVDDEQLRAAMRYLFRNQKIAVEPACAATTAASLGPFRNRIRGGTVVLVMCGSNIDWQTYAEQAGLESPHAD